METLDYYVMCEHGPEHWFQTFDAMQTDCGSCPPVSTPEACACEAGGLCGRHDFEIFGVSP